MLSCGFCGKPSTEVPTLIAGPHDNAICSDCIVLSLEIIFDLARTRTTPAAAKAGEETLSIKPCTRSPFDAEALMQRFGRIDEALAQLNKAVADIKLDIEDLNVMRKGLRRINDPFYCHYPHY